MVNRSDSDCLFEETSLDGAVGSSATTTAPGAPAILESLHTESSALALSTSDMVKELYAVGCVPQGSLMAQQQLRSFEEVGDLWRKLVKVLL